MKDFRTLKVWEKSHSMVLAVYKATESFPEYELYGITSQVRRSAVSIPTNIAEGCGKDTDPEFGRYLKIAMGSSSELEYLLMLAHDLGYLVDVSYNQLHNDLVVVRKMLNAFIQKLKANR